MHRATECMHLMPAQNVHLKTLSDFDLVRTLGTGSYGRVILSKDKHEGNFYAIKVLEKAKVVRKNQVEHTRNELSLLSSLKYEFIVNMRSYFKDNSNIFFVLDVGCCCTCCLCYLFSSC